MRTPKPDLLVDPDWLAPRLDDPRLHVIDTTVWLLPRPVGPSAIRSGWPAFNRAHVPGAAYLHMVNDLSDPDGDWAFMLRPPAALAAHLGRLGIAAGDTIVVYGDGTPSATTRAWWVLCVAGAQDVRILDGGLKRWVAEGHPVAAGDDRTATPCEFAGTPRLDLVAGLDDVLAARTDPAVALINALAPAQFDGSGGSHYGRPGRIPGSLSLPAQHLIDPDTGLYRPLDDLARAAAAVGADRYRHLITYCGGGIAASTVHFALEMLGYTDLSLYDASLNEWANRPDLPMQTG